MVSLYEYFTKEVNGFNDSLTDQPRFMQIGVYAIGK